MRRLATPANAAILCAAIAMAVPVQGVSDNQASHLALTRALASGTVRIDADASSTVDKVRREGHFYSNKAPGLALATMPAYAALDATGIPAASERAAARRGDAERDRDRGTAWAVALVGALLPAVVLMVLVALLGDKVAPGRGPAAAVTLGLATLLLPFSAMLFAHALSALLGFAAFALLWREREGPPRPELIAGAGVLAGLAVTTEYTMAAVGIVLGLYALARSCTPARAAAYSAGLLIGTLPLLAYNALAFGSPLRVSYSDVAAQSEGFFGVRPPRPDVALDILFSQRGLLTLSPVLIMAAAGVALMARRGLRAEALTIAGVCVLLLVANAGFYLDQGTPGAANQPFGGFSPGPRLLVPLLPFLALGLAEAYRRFPFATLFLALVSGLRMIVATLTEPLVGPDTGIWWDRLRAGDFTATVFTELGAGSAWAAVAPGLVAAASAVALAAVAARAAPSILSSDHDGSRP